MVGTRGGLLVEVCTYIRGHTSNTCYYITPGEATQSRKGYQLRSDLSGAGAVASQDGYKKGGCPVMISSKRGSVIVLIVNVVHQITIIFVLIIHKDFTSIHW